MNCREIDFSPQKSEERIDRSLKVFDRQMLCRILAFSLYLLGAKRKTIATLVDMPPESVKTTIRVILRDGFEALRDRRSTSVYLPPKQSEQSMQPGCSVSCDDQSVVVDFGSGENKLTIPLENKLQIKIVLLSLLQSGLLQNKDVAPILQVSQAHCRHLVNKLNHSDVDEALIDKRRGQKQDYLVGTSQKAEIIRQFTARVISGRSVSSEVLAKAVVQETDRSISARTVRWHISKLGLKDIKKTLPKLVSALKKTPESSD